MYYCGMHVHAVWISHGLAEKTHFLSTYTHTVLTVTRIFAVFFDHYDKLSQQCCSVILTLLC